MYIFVIVISMLVNEEQTVEETREMKQLREIGYRCDSEAEQSTRKPVSKQPQPANPDT
jgi:hypothetical protein